MYPEIIGGQQLFVQQKSEKSVDQDVQIIYCVFVLQYIVWPFLHTQHILVQFIGIHMDGKHLDDLFG